MFKVIPLVNCRSLGFGWNYASISYLIFCFLTISNFPLNLMIVDLNLLRKLHPLKELSFAPKFMFPFLMIRCRFDLREKT